MTMKRSGISSTSRCVCTACGWRGTDDEILSAPSPFAPQFTIYACPKCREIEQLRGCREPDTCGAHVPCIDLLAEKAERAREALTQTEGGCGSGTIACRLWQELYGLVKEIEKANAEAETSERSERK